MTEAQSHMLEFTRVFSQRYHLTSPQQDLLDNFDHPLGASSLEKAADAYKRAEEAYSKAGNSTLARNAQMLGETAHKMFEALKNQEANALK